MVEKERLMQVEMKRESANFICDMFLFLTFMGFAYVDLRNLRYDNIILQEDIKRWIGLNLQKTGSVSHIPRLDISLRIIEKYQNTGFVYLNKKVFIL